MSFWYKLNEQLEGNVQWDNLHRMMYATDASIYREYPQAVAFPKTTSDLVAIVQFCSDHNVSIIPRAGGTSLAGQVVGNGLVVDTSRYMNQILSIDYKNGLVRVQPGVIRDDLNRILEPEGWCFGPNTSTSNRATIGGMAGNNSSGTTSIYYGHTRDKVESMLVVLSDGSLHEFGSNESPEKDSLAGKIVRHCQDLQSSASTMDLISQRYPDASIKRRNSGYALDELFHMEPSAVDGSPFNLSKILCGSEGTLALTSELTVRIDPLPPRHRTMWCIEFEDVVDSLRAVQMAMATQPYQCELMDDTILDCARQNPLYGEWAGRFTEGVRALLMVEWAHLNVEEMDSVTTTLKEELVQNCQAGIIHTINGSDIPKIWGLRKAGLGLLANVPGDRKAIACIEDTAVALDVLPEYIADFDRLMAEYDQKPVYYAHAGAGELHLRPLLNLKQEKDVRALESICQASADLVIKYGGSISGEHGDGRVRAPFLKQMYGPEIYQLFLDFKQLWDPKNIFNPSKIVEAEPLASDLRYSTNQKLDIGQTAIRFEREGGLLRAAEKCNGSGDCRKSAEDGGAMCPSFQATKDEAHTTRGRANVLREVLTQADSGREFEADELKQSLDLCLSCKACYKECPSEVDMATMKATVLHGYYKSHKRPLRDRLFVRPIDASSTLGRLTALGMKWTPGFLQSAIQSAMGIAPQRKLPVPVVSNKTLDNWSGQEDIEVLIYQDELTRAFHPQLLSEAMDLMTKLGINAYLSKPVNSGRALISKGFLEEAKREIEGQLDYLSKAVDSGAKIVGLEPSAILGWRHEIPRLVAKEKENQCRVISESTVSFASWWYEFGSKQMEGIKLSQEEVNLHVHAHCHFKAIDEEQNLYLGLSALPGIHVRKIQSGCCGMAGSFGYEKEHFEVSKKIANIALLPHVRSVPSQDKIVVQGISCEHQIWDFSKRKTFHPVEIINQRIQN